MHTKLLSCFLLLGLATGVTAGALAQGTPAPAPAQPAGHIKAVAVKGGVFVTVKATNVRTALTNNAEISQGSVVQTEKDSSVVLVFSNGATINLGKESALDIEQFTQDPFSTAFNAATATDEPSTSTTKLRLNRGELVGKVAHLKKDKGSSFAVNTPVGAAGIRGTTFRIVYIPDGTGKAFFSLTTLEGNVEVTLATGTVNAPVSVTDNKEVVLADVTVTVDNTTGQVTVTTPTGTVVVPTDTSATTNQQIAAVAQQIAQSVLNVVIPSSSGNTDTPPPSGTPPPSSPPPTQTQQRTTSGDGT